MAKKEINFEVHVEQKGRWEIHARHPSGRREAAIEEAMTLEKMPNIDDVKVVRESYNPEDGSSDEAVVYKGTAGRIKARPPSMRAKKDFGSPSQSGWDAGDRGDTGGGFWGREESSDDDEKSFDDLYDMHGAGRRKKRKAAKRAQKKELGAGGVLIRILLILLFSIALASLATAISIPFLDQPKVLGVTIATTVRTYLLFAVFAVTFLMVAWPMTRSLMTTTELKQEKRRARTQAQAKPQPKPSKPARPKSEASAPSDEITDKLPDISLETAADIKPDKAPETEPKGEKKEAEKKAKEGEPLRDITADSDDAARAAADALRQSREKEEQIEAEKKEAEATPKGVVLEADKYAPPEALDQLPEPEQEKPLNSYAEKQRVALMKFLSEALAQMPADKRSLDKFNKFGVNLFLAGACEGLCQKRNLDPRSASRILAEGGKLLGYRQAEAERFADRYEDYLVNDSRYMQMFQSGRNSMITAIEDGGAANPGKLLENALTEWNTPKEKETATGPVTVMFTDMVGSTALTQTMGDAVAQQVVRAHNRIVRQALAAFSGKEVKHTGDGIMASFSTTSNSVEAAIDMQTNTEKHNKSNPDLPLKIKIGINAGEPIAEDNDLFGTTVQLSARIVDKAQADQIYVSEIVRGICAGKDIEFTNLGPFEMKGFKGGVTLYEVIWSDGGEAQPQAGTQQATPGGTAMAAQEQG